MTGAADSWFRNLDHLVLVRPEAGGAPELHGDFEADVQPVAATLGLITEPDRFSGPQVCIWGRPEPTLGDTAMCRLVDNGVAGRVDGDRMVLDGTIEVALKAGLPAAEGRGAKASGQEGKLEKAHGVNGTGDGKTGDGKLRRRGRKASVGEDDEPEKRKKPRATASNGEDDDIRWPGRDMNDEKLAPPPLMSFWYP